MSKSTNDKYTNEALRTESKLFQFTARTPRLMHIALGLTSEVGEIADQLKKHIFYGNELDETNLKEEAGDVMWYLALLMDELETTFNKEQNRNINKLKDRFPEKFTQDKVNNRDLDTERKGLEDDNN